MRSFTVRRVISALAVLMAATAVPGSSSTAVEMQRFVAVVDDAAAFAASLEAEGVDVRLVTSESVEAVVAVAAPTRVVELEADVRVVELDRVPAAPSEVFDVVREAPEQLPTDQVIAYVLDSPIEATNPWYSRGSSTVAGGYSRYNLAADDDCRSHGTRVAGTITGGGSGLVDGVTIVPLEVSCSQIDVESVLGAFEWVAINHPQGTPAVLNASLTLRSTAAYEHAVRHLTDELGIAQFWSAGNQGLDACRGLRGRMHDAVMVVGSVDGKFEVPETNFGPCVDVFGRGTRMLTADVGGGHTHVTGTSYSSPRVAAAAMRILQDQPQLSPAELFAEVLSYSQTGLVRGAGEGSPDAYLDALGLAWNYGTERAPARSGQSTSVVTSLAPNVPR